MAVSRVIYRVKSTRRSREALAVPCRLLFESRLPIGGKETELVMEQEGLTQPDDAAKPDTAAQPDDVSQPNTAAQPGEQDAKKEDSDEEQNEQL